MQTSAKFWDGVAEKYAASPIKDMDAYTYSLGRTKTYLRPTDRLLEVGSGSGSTALLLAEHAGAITASDISANMTRIGTDKAREQGVANVRFVTADVLDDSLVGEPYDVVMALNLLHLLEDLDAALDRFNRMLKPGGLFISKTICLSGPGTTFKYRVMRLALPIMQCLGKAPYVNFMTIPELEGRITAHGFKIIETGNYPASPPSRYVVARKD
ncbi:class I SAM-dependent methyltransferase [Bauldia sp.]|uniref:class I SAM-dependent methyltransferase n=1 Tax=Bauldia sp. TaxID=2575872 RepID=UPI003BA909F3